MATILEQLNDNIASVLDTVRKSLVQIHTERGCIGAATIWHPDGLIVTNAHVVQEQPFKVRLQDGRELPARILGADSQKDLAAIMVDASNLPAIELGNSHELKPGQMVFALGHPWGIKSAATAGVIIGADAEGAASGAIPVGSSSPLTCI